MSELSLEYKFNARHLEKDLLWFRKIVETRYLLFHNKACDYKELSGVPLPVLNGHQSGYSRILSDLSISWEERLVLLLALIPHVQPHLMTDLIGAIISPKGSNNADINARVPAPTIDTALFLLAGDDLEQRFFYENIFMPGSRLMDSGILYTEPEPGQDSRLDAKIKMREEWLSLLTSGNVYVPEYSHSFPAKRIYTSYNWEDLILPDKSREEVEEIWLWIEHSSTVLYEWELGRKFAPGYKCLFYGAPGTGKSMAAALLGKLTDRPVFRIDLALVISKYIGETEKNLKNIFDSAEHRGWILFFDEADALFSKRTEIKDAHDRFANQEVSYLLHRIEEYDGVVILATNRMNNMDEAFTRRFQNTIPFPMPGSYERLSIWEKGFSKKTILEKAVDLEKIARDYNLSGGSIINVIRYASLKAAGAGENIIMLKDILRGIQREYTKEGKSR